MDDLWVTLSEAARILQVTARQLRRYRSDGCLQEKRVGRTTLVLARDVKDLRRLKSNPERFVLGDLQTHVLLTRLVRLEREVEMLKLVADIDVAPISLDLASAEALHVSCTAAAGQKNHQLQEFETWINIFAGLRVGSLTSIMKVTSEIHPWEMFLVLADRLVEELVNANGFENDLALQMLHDRLLRARGTLREESTLFEASQGRMNLPLTALPGAHTSK